MEMNKYTVQKAIGYHPMLLVSVVTIFSRLAESILASESS